MNHKLCVWVLLILCLVSVVAAVPKTVQVEVESARVLTISIPRQQFIKQGVNYTFHTHVFNGSGIELTSGDVNCTLHVYGPEGAHILKTQFVADDREYQAGIPGNVVGKGIIPYIIFCENHTRGYGGFISDSFIGTADGKMVVNEGQGGLATILYVLFVTGLLFAVVVLPYPLSGNKITDLILRRCALTIGMYMLLFNSTIVASLAVQTGLAVEKEIFSYMFVVGILAYCSIIYLIIRTILDVSQMFEEKKHKEMIYGKNNQKDQRV